MADFLDLAQQALKIAGAAQTAIGGATGGKLGVAISIGQSLLPGIDAVLDAVRGEPVSEELQRQRDALRAEVNRRAQEEEDALRG